MHLKPTADNTIVLKSPREIAIMREAGRLVAETIRVLEEDAEAGMDLARLYMTQLRVYLVGWEGESFQDEKGKLIEVTPSAIDMLDPDLAEEMMTQIRRWLTEVRAAREANPTITNNFARRSR